MVENFSVNDEAVETKKSGKVNSDADMGTDGLLIAIMIFATILIPIVIVGGIYLYKNKAVETPSQSIEITQEGYSLF